MLDVESRELGAVRRGFVALRSGLRLECAESGEASGPALVLLHGVTDSWRSFEDVMPLLARGGRVVALTQRGHGGSDKPAGGYRTLDYVEDVIEAADALGIERFALLGHSMGASNALGAAIVHPERVSRLILVGAMARFRANAVIKEFVRDVVEGLEDPIPDAVAREFQESTLARPVRAGLLEMVTAESLRAPARVWRQSFAGFLEDAFADRLGEVRAPTLLLRGAMDAIGTHADQEALLSGIRGARLETYERTGHALHWEEPDRFAASVTAFLSRP